MMRKGARTRFWNLRRSAAPLLTHGLGFTCGWVAFLGFLEKYNNVNNVNILACVDCLEKFLVRLIPLGPTLGLRETVDEVPVRTPLYNPP